MTLDPARMAELRRRFVAAVPDQADALDACLAAGDGAGARRIAHLLAGRAGMFGHRALGEIALAADEADEAQLTDRSRALLEALRQLPAEG